MVTSQYFKSSNESSPAEAHSHHHNHDHDHSDPHVHSNEQYGQYISEDEEGFEREPQVGVRIQDQSRGEELNVQEISDDGKILKKQSSRKEKELGLEFKILYCIS